jgi:hypothetical protein
VSGGPPAPRPPRERKYVQIGRAADVSEQLQRMVAGRVQKLVRDITETFHPGLVLGWDDYEVTRLTYLIGVFGADCTAAGKLEAYAEKSLRDDEAPAATSSEDPGHTSPEATTKRFRRGEGVQPTAAALKKRLAAK